MTISAVSIPPSSHAHCPLPRAACASASLQFAHTSLVTYQCGGHHLFKPLGLGLVVEVHTAHEVISWEKPTATIKPCYMSPCLHCGCPSLPVPTGVPVPLPESQWSLQSQGMKGEEEKRVDDRRGKPQGHATECYLNSTAGPRSSGSQEETTRDPGCQGTHL